MIIKKISPSKINKKTIQTIAQHFKAGKIVAYPAETVYGIGALASREDLIKKIYKIKKRNKQKPFLVLVKSYCDLRKYFFVNAKQNEIIKKIYPKPFGAKRVRPTTIILKSRGLLPKILEQDNKIAVRLPMANKWGREFLIPLIKEIGEPIISTSANLSGKEIINNPEKIQKTFPQLDLVIDTGIKKAKTSRIIDLTENKIKIIR